MSTPDYDVIVVGASLAGCTSAILLAREGLKVALIERHAQDDAHKAMCTHFIQSSALSVMKRLGIDRQIEEAGGLRNEMEFHTAAGWAGCHLHLQEDPNLRHGYNIRRRKLDPMMRQLASDTPGVTMMLGVSVKGLVESEGRIAGVELGGSKGQGRLTARLVVGADGRQSSLATMAGVKAKSSPNVRYGILAPMRNVDLQRGNVAQMWFKDPEVAYVFPNDDGVTVLTWMGLKESFDSVRDRPLETMLERIRELPQAPQLHQAELAGDVLVIKDYPNLWRPPVVRGMALVGDAFMSLDYLQGIGCGWALQGGAWLCDAIAADLKAGKSGKALDAGLKRYARQCATLTAHRFMINDFAKSKSMSAIHKLIMAASVKDVKIALIMGRLASRIDGPGRMLSPGVLLRALWVTLTRSKSVPLTTNSPRSIG